MKLISLYIAALLLAGWAFGLTDWDDPTGRCSSRPAYCGATP